MQIEPFLMWAGGKRWLSLRDDVFPEGIEGTYFEPFLGSGAVYFTLLPERAVLSDINEHLIAVYQAIKTDWKAVDRHLRNHQKLHSDVHYEAVRRLPLNGSIASASRFLYLNHACWNGLYRVNLKGQFNVPKGSKENVRIAPELLSEVARRLTNVKLEACDFEKSIERAVKGDFVFADPPYISKRNSNGFVKYSNKLFSWEDQLRLHHVLTKASKRGANICVTNIDQPSIWNLYKNNFSISRVYRQSLIASDSAYRGRVSELLIRSY